MKLQKLLKSVPELDVILDDPSRVQQEVMRYVKVDSRNINFITRIFILNEISSRSFVGASVVYITSVPVFAQDTICVETCAQDII